VYTQKEKKKESRRAEALNEKKKTTKQEQQPTNYCSIQNTIYNQSNSFRRHYSILYLLFFSNIVD